MKGVGTDKVKQDFAVFVNIKSSKKIRAILKQKKPFFRFRYPSYRLHYRFSMTSNLLTVFVREKELKNINCLLINENHWLLSKWAGCSV